MIVRKIVAQVSSLGGHTAHSVKYVVCTLLSNRSRCLSFPVSLCKVTSVHASIQSTLDISPDMEISRRHKVGMDSEVFFYFFPLDTESCFGYGLLLLSMLGDWETGSPPTGTSGQAHGWVWWAQNMSVKDSWTSC